MSEQNNEKFEKKLTTEEIEEEITKVKDFFKQIPDELKAETAERFVFETILWGSYDQYQALGILEEAKLRYREVSVQILEEEEMEECRRCDAYEAAIDYQCIIEVDWTVEPFSPGDIVKAVYAGEDDSYNGGGKYDVFVEETHSHYSICKEGFESHFQLVEKIN